MRLEFCRMAPLALLLMGGLGAGVAHAQQAARFFEENCAVCHTIGGGDQAGPDLKGSTDRKDRRWLVRFLLDPEGVIGSGDEYAKKLVAQWNDIVMPTADGMTREMAEELVEFIERQSRQSTAAPPAPPPIAFTDADRARGLDIFTGRVRLANAGPPCLSCHALGGIDATAGGMLGPDLAAVHTRLGGAQGTTAWLSRPPTPMMRAIYQRKGLTADESRSLAALFERTATATAAPVPASRRSFVLTGIGGAIVGLAAIGLVWRGRFRNVRRRLF